MKVWSDSTFFALHFRIYRRTSEHIMYMNALGQPIIVLHSFKAAFELLNWHANIYSDLVIVGGKPLSLRGIGLISQW